MSIWGYSMLSYAGASKVKLDKDQKSVEGAIRQSILKIRKVQFLLMVNEPQPNETRTDAVLLCGTGRKIKTARNELPKYYKCFGQGMATSMVAEGQAFQVNTEIKYKKKRRFPCALLFSRLVALPRVPLALQPILVNLHTDSGPFVYTMYIYVCIPTNLINICSKNNKKIFQYVDMRSYKLL